MCQAYDAEHRAYVEARRRQREVIGDGDCALCGAPADEHETAFPYGRLIRLGHNTVMVNDRGEERWYPPYTPPVRCPGFAAAGERIEVPRCGCRSVSCR